MFANTLENCAPILAAKPESDHGAGHVCAEVELNYYLDSQVSDAWCDARDSGGEGHCL